MAEQYPGAETWRQFYSRVYNIMELLSVSPKDRLIIVTHRGVIINIVLWWLGIELACGRIPFSINADPAGITVLTINRRQEKVIDRLNDTAHVYKTPLAKKLIMD